MPCPCLKCALPLQYAVPRKRQIPFCPNRAALCDSEFTAELRAFIASFDDSYVHFDGQIDNVQLHQTLAGFGYNSEGQDVRRLCADLDARPQMANDHAR